MNDHTITLFKALVNEYKIYLESQKTLIDKEMITFPESEADRLGQALFTAISKGGYCTMVVTGRQVWNPKTHYYEAVRFTARRGCKICRSFLLPHRHLKHNASLQKHIELDREAGIHVKVLYIGDMLATSSLSMTGSLDFGLWDGELACVGLVGKNGIEGWRITCRDEDIQHLNGIKEVLENLPDILCTSENDKSLDLEEPMITTAPIAYELANVLCKGDHVSSNDCCWYHSIWQFLRIFNMVSTPTWHSAFYIKSLCSLSAKISNHRILISGTADYSMLAHVLWAYGANQIHPEVTVLDLCETPLFLCKWYGKHVGIRIKTESSDVLTYAPSAQFDAIVTDAFLTRFDRPERTKVVQKWFDLLCIGGSVITSIRVETGASQLPVKASIDEICMYKKRVLQEARKWQDFLPCPPEHLADMAQKYAENMSSYSFSSEQEIVNLFSGIGFVVETCEANNVPGEMASSLYYNLIAIKP